MAELTRFNKSSILVTGATGAIGLAVCRDLTTHGYQVFGLARSVSARARLPYATIAVNGDIRHPEAWESWIRQVDAVIHLAVPTDEFGGGPKEREEAEKDARIMADILNRLATLCRKSKKLLIHTFGALLYEPDAEGWVRESCAISSGKGFGIRHRIAYPVLERQRQKGLKAISVNPAFVYGRGGWFTNGVLLPMSQGRSTMIGDGTQTMHYIAATDTAAGYRLAIEKGIVGEDYLLADDQPSTIGEFTRLVAKELDAPVPTPVPEATLIPILGAWTVEAYTFCPKVDSSKARRHLGWAPQYRTIQDGIPVVVREYRNSLKNSRAA